MDFPGTIKSRMRSSGGHVETWVPVSLLVATLWSVAAVRYSKWLGSGQEKAEKWKASYGNHQSLSTAFRAWLLENGILLALAMVSKGTFPPRDRRSLKKLVALQILRSLLITEGVWVILGVCLDRLYVKMPYFAAEQYRPHPSWKDFISSWARLMIPLRVLGAVNESMQMQSAGEAEYHMLSHGPRSEGLGCFLFQFAVIRSLHDLGFYAGHWIIHQPWFYGWIHKRHHEHKEPGVVTNNHFWILDLMIESGASLSAALWGISIFEKAGFLLSNFERNYIVVALLWYENGSHAGKQLPCVTVFPPLSFIPWIDRTLGGGVAHHHEHHRHLQSNYSIAAWPDRAFGTWKPLINDATGKTGSSPKRTFTDGAS